MAGLTYPAWLPTDLTNFAPTNCTLASSFYVQALTSNDAPMQKTLDVLKDSLQGYWMANNVSIPSSGEIAAFVVDALEAQDTRLAENITNSVGHFVGLKCLANYCEDLPWQGNADLSGRGMLVSYFVQAGLATFYMIILGLGRLNKSSRHFKRSSLYERVLVAVQESTKSFLDASVLFCIVMLVATLYTFARALANPNALITTYVQFSSALISFFTIFPTVLLHACASNHLRRGKFRQIVWAFIGCLTITVAALFLNVGSSALIGRAGANANGEELQELENFVNRVSDAENQNIWEYSCVDRGVMEGFILVIIIAMCCMVLLTTFYLVVLKNVLRIPFLKAKGRPKLKKFRKNWWWVSGILAFAGMWATLGAFVYFRTAYNRLAGTTNKDKEWSFGQILALATWVPVVVELLFIGRKGAVEALTGQLSDKYQVVLAPEVHRRDTDMTVGSTSGDSEKGNYTPVVVAPGK